MNHWRKWLLMFPLAALLCGWAAPAALAAPYEGYNYSYWNEPEPAPVPYLPDRQITGQQVSAGPFNAPEDLFVTQDGHIYVADTGNNRIVRLDANWNVTRIIDSFDNNGKEDGFSAPSGLFVTGDGHLFVADTNNKRIVELTAEGELVRVIGPPEADVLPENFSYQPIKLVVDLAGRLYVVGRGVFDGIMQFNAGGTFTGFIGVNKVRYSPVELFWKTVLTREQRSKMVLFIPVEFNNVDIDEEGFIYATTAEQNSTAPVKRLNPSGDDVLKRNGYRPPMGDTRWSFTSAMPGSSQIVAVTVDEKGIYSILDRTRGRVFTYDRDGKLMYIFGLNGEQKGTFKIPVDIDMLGDQILVLDKGLNHIVVFRPTLYGKTVRDAVIYTEIGEEEKAIAAWRKALQMNSNLEIAYIGIGKAELRQGNNLEAMKNFRLGMHLDYYSRAFERYRKEFMWEHFGTIAGGLLACVAVMIVAARIMKRKSVEPGVVGMAWYTALHPFKGFWDLKFEKKGKVWFALVLLLLLSILYTLKRQYSGFIFNPGVDFANASILQEMTYIVLPFFLWCVANWSLTTLMDGEGKFHEIVTATAYALVPIILVQIPLILLSNMLTVQEASFYRLLETIANLWFVYLLFVGMLTVHQYSVTKTLATMLLTLIVIGIIVFLGLLFFSLLQQMMSFGTTVYKEIVFRMAEG